MFVKVDNISVERMSSGRLFQVTDQPHKNVRYNNNR